MPLELHSIDQFDFHQAPVYGVAAANNHLYSVGGDRQVFHYWMEADQYMAERIALLNHAGYCCHVHEKWIFAGDAQGYLYRFHFDDKESVKVMKAHDGGIFKLTSDAEQLYSIGQDGKLNLWSFDPLEMKRTLWLSAEKLRDLCWNDSMSQLAVVGQDGILRVLELPMLNEIFTSLPMKDGLTSVAYWPEKKTWVSGNKQGQVQFWKQEQSSPIFDFQAHKGNIYGLSVDTENQLIWTSSLDKSIKAWEMTSLALAGKWDNLNQSPLRSVNQILMVNPNIFISAGDNKKIDVTKICFFK